MTSPVTLVSTSAAVDGGFTAVANINTAMELAGASNHHRLIGGVAVMLHIERLQLELPLRVTGDADFGVVPLVLQDRRLIDAIEAMGYSKTFGNRWERPIDDRRVAAVDLLVPAYTSRARDTVRVGSVVTTEVPGLAEAFRQPSVSLEVTFQLQDGSLLDTAVVLPDAVGMLALKVRVRAVRQESRDAQDIWRCLEIAAADDITPSTFDGDAPLRQVRQLLWQEVGPGGNALDEVTAGIQSDAAARLRTRLRALLVEVVGEPNDIANNSRL